MRKKELVRWIAASVNVTNAVPKRVLQICSVLETLCPVEQVCWDRFERGNVPEAFLINAHSLFFYMLKVAKTLISRHYRILLFDDLRLLPMLVIIGRLTGAKIIYNRQEVPTVDVEFRLARLLRLPDRFIKLNVKRLESFFAHSVHAVLTIPIAEDELIRLVSWRKPVVTMWNVPDVSSVVASKPLLSDQPKAAPTFIYAGAVSEENGLVQYLRLVRLLNERSSNARLILIGRLWKMTKQILNAVILAESCGDYVEYRNWVPYDELLEVLVAADIGLALSDPSYYKYTHMGEGASRKVFTYMAAGLPVIAGGKFGRIVADEGAGYFVSYDDLDAIIDAAENLMSSPVTAREMGERGRLAVLHQYNWSVEQAKLERIFHQVVG